MIGPMGTRSSLQGLLLISAERTRAYRAGAHSCGVPYMGTSASPSTSATCSDGILFCVMIGFPYGPENRRSPGALMLL